jgi:Calcineurin-like phosphoesterase
MSEIRIEPATADVLDRIISTGLDAVGESPGAASSPELTPEQLRELLRLVRGAREVLLDASESDTDLGAPPEVEGAALLQSWLEQNATARARVENLDGEVKFDERDLRWGLSLLNWLRGLKRHALVRPSGPPETLAERTRIALLGDWGSGRYGAPAIGKTVAAGVYDMAIHLGDVYYSGTEREVRENFLRHWPSRPNLVSRALNSNHEMYSGGYGYFGITLPRFGQSGSYFAAQNAHFTLLGLDTAYVDHDLDAEQLAWVRGMVEQAGARKVIFLSHHQLYKPGGAIAKDLMQRVKPLLESGKVFAWYWGHEHVAAIFEPDRTHSLHARCIGHSGFPYFRYKGDAALETGLEGARWRIFPGDGKVPRARVLDDPNPFVPEKPERYGAQGFASLALDGPSLTERVHRPDGTVIYEQQLC